MTRARSGGGGGGGVPLEPDPGLRRPGGHRDLREPGRGGADGVLQPRARPSARRGGAARPTGQLRGEGRHLRAPSKLLVASQQYAHARPPCRPGERSKPYRICLKSVSNLYRICQESVSRLYRIYIESAKNLYRDYIESMSNLSRICLEPVSNLYRVSQESVSSLYRICIEIRFHKSTSTHTHWQT